MSRLVSRRNFMRALGAGGVGLIVPRLGLAQTGPAIITRDAARPKIAAGIQAGDVGADGRALIWTRADRPSRLVVDYASSDSFADARRVLGSDATPATDFTARAELAGLPAGQTIFYRVSLLDLGDLKTQSLPMTGRLRMPAARSDVHFVWSADTVGQGWGINPEWGEMRIYEAMRKQHPDFFIHSGDTIYADGPLAAEVPLDDGGVWKNLVTEAKSKVAESLAEFRGNYAYNWLDENYRRFAAEVPQIWQWDDHEVVNNWSNSKVLDDRYTEKRIGVLSARARQAFLEYAPVRPGADRRARIHRKIGYGPLLDVFVVDMRSFRGANSHNTQPVESAETEFLGRAQIAWLAQELRQSNAMWKVIAADMPLGLIVGDGKDAQGRDRFEGVANRDGKPLGRELELAGLLRTLKRARVGNMVWLTGDVHYTAAHYYDPAKAQFTEFDPFWEFISGPLNAGTFGPSALDNTFGPQVIWQKTPPPGKLNLPPSAGLQFFGQVRIEARTGAMTVTLRDLTGAALYTKTLEPAR